MSRATTRDMAGAMRAGPRKARRESAKSEAAVNLGRMRAQKAGREEMARIGRLGGLAKRAKEKAGTAEESP